MNQKNLLKAANSKSQLAKACMMYQRALAHYANELHWVVKGDDIIWIGDDSPTYAAQVSLGKCKPDAKYVERNKKSSVREPDKGASNANNQR